MIPKNKPNKHFLQNQISLLKDIEDTKKYSKGSINAREFQ